MLIVVTTLVACTPTSQSPTDDNKNPSVTLPNEEETPNNPSNDDDEDNPSVTPPTEEEETPDEPTTGGDDDAKAEIDLAKQLMVSTQISYDMIDEYNLNEYDTQTTDTENAKMLKANYLSAKMNVNTVNDDYLYYTKEGYYDNFNCLTSIKTANTYTKQLGQTIEKYMQSLNDIVQAFDITYRVEIFNITAVVEKIQDGCQVVINNPNHEQTFDLGYYGKVTTSEITYTIQMTNDYTFVKVNYDSIDLSQNSIPDSKKEWIQQTLLLTKENAQLIKTEYSYFFASRIKIDLLKTAGESVQAIEYQQAPEGYIYNSITNFKDSFAVCINLQAGDGATDVNGTWFDKESNKMCWTIQFFYKDSIIYNSFPLINSVTLPAIMVDGWEQMTFLKENIDLENIWGIYGFIPEELTFSNGRTEYDLYPPDFNQENPPLIMNYMPVCSLRVIQNDGSIKLGRGQFVSTLVRDETLQEFYQPFFDEYELSLKSDANIQNWFNTANVQTLLTKQVAEDFELSNYVNAFAEFDISKADDLFAITVQG